MNYLFTSESVSEGHPDKLADQISDAILDQFIALDPESKVACETLTTTGQVVIAGEVKSNVYVDVQDTARRVISRVGYTKSEYCFAAESCGILSALHEQSADINRGVERADRENQGAGDQGIMFGYATAETPNYMPLPIDLSHALLKELAHIRHNELELMPYLRPDAKSQVTVEYNKEHQPQRIDTIVISTQHDDFVTPKNDSPEAVAEAEAEMLQKIKHDIETILIPRVRAKYSDEVARLFGQDIKLHVNPTGKFVIGGPHGDTGLTGRKIIVDTYGGKGAHGGGAFSGKDPSKVDRSAAYATRHIAKNLVAAGVADEVLVQVSYAIGVAEPCGLYINTYGTSKLDINDGELAKRVQKLFDLRPYAVEKNLKLRNPIYLETAAYGHMGKDYYVADKTFNKGHKNELTLKDLEFFTWEKLDRVDDVKKEFGL